MLTLFGRAFSYTTLASILSRNETIIGDSKQKELQK
jgi:hypothetical protein